MRVDDPALGRINVLGGKGRVDKLLGRRRNVHGEDARGAIAEARVNRDARKVALQSLVLHEREGVLARAVEAGADQATLAGAADVLGRLAHNVVQQVKEKVARGRQKTQEDGEKVPRTLLVPLLRVEKGLLEELRKDFIAEDLDFARQANDRVDHAKIEHVRQKVLVDKLEHELVHIHSDALHVVRQNSERLEDRDVRVGRRHAVPIDRLVELVVREAANVVADLLGKIVHGRGRLRVVEGNDKLGERGAVKVELVRLDDGQRVRGSLARNVGLGAGQRKDLGGRHVLLQIRRELVHGSDDDRVAVGHGGSGGSLLCNLGTNRLVALLRLDLAGLGRRLEVHEQLALLENTATLFLGHVVRNLEVLAVKRAAIALSSSAALLLDLLELSLGLFAGSLPLGALLLARGRQLL